MSEVNLKDFIIDDDLDISQLEEVYEKEDYDEEEKEIFELPWIEKYRPKNIEDIVLEENTYRKIKNIIAEKDMPNIIITGVPGIGKTTTIQCIARGIFGKNVKDSILELNASDDRGIRAVQDTIITICKKKNNSNHKIIILDEADNMTSKAQRLINNLMEKYHKTTRFAFTCNNSSDIIEAIQSRCIIFRYYRLGKEKVINRLKYICEQENVNYNDDAIEELSVASQGDMRYAINNLQLISDGLGDVVLENVYKMCDKPHTQVIKKILDTCKKKDIKKAIQLVLDLKKNGYSGSDIMLSMRNTLKLADYKGMDEATKLKVLSQVSKTSYNISRGVDTDLQLVGCISSIILNL